MLGDLASLRVKEVSGGNEAHETLLASDKTISRLCMLDHVRHH
jgi:hypothetical protein